MWTNFPIDLHWKWQNITKHYSSKGFKATPPQIHQRDGPDV